MKWDAKDPLSRWVSSQRQRGQQGKLSQEKIDLLNKVNFVWDPMKEEWMEKYHLYEQHLQEGNTISKEMSSWCYQQRTSYMNGKLQTYKINLLEKLNFKWETGQIYDEFWEDNFSKLIKHIKETGSAKFPKINEHPIGSWIKNQRNAYKANSLEQGKINRLNKVGFIWDEREFIWMENYVKVKYFSIRHGKQVPLNHPDLGNWVMLRRQEFRKGKLSEKRIKLLEKIKG